MEISQRDFERVRFARFYGGTFSRRGYKKGLDSRKNCFGVDLQEFNIPLIHSIEPSGDINEKKGLNVEPGLDAHACVLVSV